MEISEPKKSSKKFALIILPKDDRDKLSTTDFKARIGASLPEDVKIQAYTFNPNDGLLNADNLGLGSSRHKLKYLIVDNGSSSLLTPAANASNDDQLKCFGEGTLKTVEFLTKMVHKNPSLKSIVAPRVAVIQSTYSYWAKTIICGVDTNRKNTTKNTNFRFNIDEKALEKYKTPPNIATQFRNSKSKFCKNREKVSKKAIK